MTRLPLVFALALLPLAGLTAQQQIGTAQQPIGTAQHPAGTAPLNVIPVQGKVHMISGAGVNITVHVGKYGVLFVDTPSPAAVAQVMEQVRKLSTLPIRWVINTSSSPDHVAGNAAVLGLAGGRGAAGAPFGFVGLGRPSIVAHENVLNRLSNPAPGTTAATPDALPTTTYFQPSMDFSNGEAIVLYHQPAAHTDSDSVVLFRSSDVISAGSIFTPGRYPTIDLARGGSVNGLISALTNILALAVPEGFASGGTLIVPAYGRICEETDVAEFRDMVVIVRDRVQDLIAKKMTWEQIRASRPSRDYDAEYGASPADTDRFVESIYRSLTQPQRGRP
jgi:glyoxylase-like metal-dependent hydrolase (beta-lactamase superfamily II)